MKKIFSMSVIAAMVTMILSVGASANTTNNIVLGDGKCAVVVKCVVGGSGIACDNLPDSDTGIIHPEQDNDTPSGDSGVIHPEQDNDTPSEGSSMNEYEKEVVRLVNEIRVENGLSEIVADEELSRVARIKSQDMKDNNYFSHTSPVYGSPFDMMKNFGISYKTAGENIARGQATPQAVVDGWMNSSGHRANILNASYNRIGVGYVADGNYWTQMFIGR